MKKTSLETKSTAAGIIENILNARGYSTEAEIEAFINPSYENHLHDPFLLTDMEIAVERILKAVEQRQNIVIYGDYDIDGITASTLMLETLQNLGWQARSYIPDRFEEGYGINLEALKQLRKAGTELVISVDCGVTSVGEIEWANDNGLDVVITDHHAVPEIIPRALAVINPKRPGDKYPFKELAGVGVAFKLAQALQMKTGKPKAGQEKWLLDLVALGTVCDVVTLVGENRVLASFGLRVLRQTRRVGLRTLAEAAGVVCEDLSAYHLGFVLGPRLNASGRLEHASRSLELLRLEDEALGRVIAEELNDLNRQRQADQAAIFAAANKQAEQYGDDGVLVLADKDWSHGVVGIVASKLVEKWRKPTLVAQILGEKTKGSARSTGQFNLVEGLREVSEHFERFGGHYFAAGFTLKTKYLDRLRKDLNRYYKSLNLPVVSGSLKQSDIRLENLSQLTDELYDGLQKLEPYGNGNPKPIFETEVTLRTVNSVGRDGSHLKLEVEDKIGNRFKGIGFGLGAQSGDMVVGSECKAVFQLNKNEYMGRTNLELTVVELRYE